MAAQLKVDRAVLLYGRHHVTRRWACTAGTRADGWKACALENRFPQDSSCTALVLAGLGNVSAAARGSYPTAAAFMHRAAMAHAALPAAPPEGSLG